MKNKTIDFPAQPIRIPTALVRAAQSCVATDDFRKMLYGICLRPDGYVQATNGTVAFQGATHTHDIEPIPMQQVIMIHGKVPATRATCEFEWHDADHGTVRCIDTLKGLKPDVLAAFEVIHEVRDLDDMQDQIFPDFTPLFAHRPLEPVATIGMSSSILAAVGKTFGSWMHCSLNFHGTSGNVTVQPLAESWSEFQASLLLMPMSSVAEDSSEPISNFGLESVEDLKGWVVEFRDDEESEPELDALYDQVRDLVKESRKASVSFIQRRMKVGYNRAARIVEQLEANGVVSPVKANGTREVLAPVD